MEARRKQAGKTMIESLQQVLHERQAAKWDRYPVRAVVKRRRPE